MTDEQQFMIDCITTELVSNLQTDRNLDLQTAIDIVYNSDTFAKLSDLATGLYYQSPLYVYEMLCDEFSLEK